MKEFVEKLIERLEELKASGNPYDSYWDEAMYRATELVNSTSNKTIDGIIEIVKQLAEEYNNDYILVHTQGLDVGIQCAMCTNPMKSDRGCDGGCSVNEEMYKKVLDVIERHTHDAPYQPKGE